jgi:hypothetical protein
MTYSTSWEFNDSINSRKSLPSRIIALLGALDEFEQDLDSLGRSETAVVLERSPVSRLEVRELLQRALHSFQCSLKAVGGRSEKRTR